MGHPGHEDRGWGQMFMVGFRGQTLRANDWVVKDIEEFDLGGILLFDRNIDGSVQNFDAPEKLKNLTSALQSCCDSTLLVAVDQEGGAVCRLKPEDGFPAVCSAARMAAGGKAVVRRNAALIAETLCACGVNFNFAPVVDLDLNPDNPIIGRYGRSFGSDVDVVVAMAEIFIEEHQRCGVGCCLKHFPGHGSAGWDSHKGFVDVTQCWQSDELLPFQRLIGDGFRGGVMTGHLVHTLLEPNGRPATLSHALLSDLLLGKLAFSGVVFSDDLQMRAITHGWSYKKAVQLAVLAGVDVLVIGNNISLQEDAVKEGIAAIEELLDQGLINGDRIEQSLQKIQELKATITGILPWSSDQPIM
ncbi:MAG: glycoside hydrolase family 3 [Desulfobulbus propionicus]|nr:MAG: glycoside hydrolase family 3 [Desulfobulbus propionicus]